MKNQYDKNSSWKLEAINLIVDVLFWKKDLPSIWPEPNKLEQDHSNKKYQNNDEERNKEKSTFSPRNYLTSYT